MITTRATTTDYRLALSTHWDRIAHSDALTDYRIEPIDGDYSAYLMTDNGDYVVGGFIVKATGELVGLWSHVPGNGNGLVTAAIAYGATSLDCFDGYLPTLYGRHGFVIVRREANWIAGGPDVVYMHLPHWN